MCQNYAREKWIQKEASYLLDSKYFHIITTIPYELNEKQRAVNKERFPLSRK